MQRCLLTVFFLQMTSLGVKAQGWTASAVANGNYYLYNVGAQAFLSNGASWGTHAVVANEGFLVNLSRVSDGVYTIGTNAKYSGKYFTDNGYVDTGSATNWTFEPVNGQVNTYKLKTSLGKYAYAAAGMYNMDEFAQAHSPDVEEPDIHVVRHDDQNMPGVLRVIFYSPDHRKVFKLFLQLRHCAKPVKGFASLIRVVIADHKPVITQFPVFTDVFQYGYF